MFSYAYTSKTMQLICFQGREDRLQLCVSHELNLRKIEKTIFFQSDLMTYNGHYVSLSEKPSNAFAAAMLMRGPRSIGTGVS